MFNVYLYKENEVLPDDDICYIISKNGILLKKKIGIIESMIPVDKISILGEITPYAKMDIPKISKIDFAKIINFFKEVYKLYHSEANIIIHYNDTLKKYIFQVPKQKVSSGHVKYLNNVQYDGYNRIGTIHSHASMGAFHSGIDDIDENDWDGLHFTIGNLDDKYISISSSIVINAKRFKVNPEDYIEEIKYNQSVEKKQSKYILFFNESKNNYYIEDGEKYKFPSEWLNFIDKYSYKKHYMNISKKKSEQYNIFNTNLFKRDEYNSKNKNIIDDPCKYCKFKKFDNDDDIDILDDDDELFDKDTVI